jgi:hypothetical protein
MSAVIVPSGSLPSSSAFALACATSAATSGSLGAPVTSSSAASDEMTVFVAGSIDSVALPSFTP